jgi:uncharacterized SAM-binding protein YcdF (DUF218 family)
MQGMREGPLSVLLACCLLAIPALFLAFTPSDPQGLDAILVCGGGQTPTGPPPWVRGRIKKAAEMYHAHKGEKPFVVLLSRGTPHKPCPRDAAGFTITEAAMNAKVAWLEYGIDPENILEETVSLDTIGNAHFTRLLHTEPLGLHRLAVITSKFHMARVQAIFSHVFSIPSVRSGPYPAYTLDFVATDDYMPADVLAARSVKEAVAAPRFGPGSPWRRRTPSVRELHLWMFSEHKAYAVQPRLNETRAPLNLTLAKSYRA